MDILVKTNTFEEIRGSRVYKRRARKDTPDAGMKACFITRYLYISLHDIPAPCTHF